MSYIVLSPGPRLTYRRWSTTLPDPGWTARDVLADASAFLFDEVRLARGTTLADVLALLDACSDLKRVFHRCFASELCDEARLGLSPDFVPGYHADGIEYLELYQVWRRHRRTRRYASPARWDFRGVGYALRTATADGTYRAGQRVHWGVGTAPVRELLALPLRVTRAVPVCEDDPDAKGYGHLLETVRTSWPTLGQLLDGVLWELSFFRPSADRAVGAPAE